MERLDRQFKLSNASITDPLFNIDKTVVTSTIPKYDIISSKSFKFLTTMFHLQQQTGVPNFCSKTSGKGMDTDYLVEAAEDPDNSVIIYNTPTDETNVVMVYNYSVNENAMHILAFCVNQEIDFGIPGWRFMNEFNLLEAGVSPVIQCSFHTFLIMTSYMKSLLSGFVNKLQKTPISGFQEVKDLARHAGMSAIILESVGSALDFYKKQGFKVNNTKVGVTGADSNGLYPMESHYQGKWSSPVHSKTLSKKKISSLIKKQSSSLSSSSIRKKSSKSKSKSSLNMNLMNDSDISSFSLSSHKHSSSSSGSGSGSGGGGGGKNHNVILIQLNPNMGSKDKYFVYNPSTHKRQQIDARPTKKSTRYGDDFLTGSEYERAIGSTSTSSSNKKTRKSIKSRKTRK
jgi:hypothetical protein